MSLTLAWQRPRGYSVWIQRDETAGCTRNGYAYSAIRADLWAIGLIRTVLVLWHKGPTPNDGLEDVSTQLLSRDPLKRPMLNDILSIFYFSDRERVSISFVY